MPEEMYIDEKIRIMRKAMREASLLNANLVIEVDSYDFEDLRNYVSYLMPAMRKVRKIRFMGVDIKKKLN